MLIDLLVTGQRGEQDLKKKERERERERKEKQKYWNNERMNKQGRMEERDAERTLLVTL